MSKSYLKSTQYRIRPDEKNILNELQSHFNGMVKSKLLEMLIYQEWIESCSKDMGIIKQIMDYKI